MEITKNLDLSIEFIRTLQSEYELSGIPLKDRNGTLIVKERHLEINFVLSLHESIDALKIIDVNEFCIRNNLTGNRYLIPDRCGFLSGATNLTADENAACPYTIKISNMMECGWNKDDRYFYRFLLPIEKEYWSGDINTLVFHYKRSYSRGLIPIKLDSGTIHIYPVHIDRLHFIAIESQFACSYDDMQKYIYSISLSLGLVTSVVTFDYAYIFASINECYEKDMYCGFSEMRNSIKGQYRFFTTNMFSLETALKYNKVEYALAQICDESGQVISNLQDWMQLDEFDRLVKMLYGNDDLARAVLILIESSTFALDYEGSMCAVALETICSALYKPKQSAFIANDCWQKNVLPEFANIIHQLLESGTITEEHAKTMQKKLNGLNMPTNGDKLSVPFTSRGCSLSKLEKEVIRNRNRFLHGKIIGRTYDEAYKEILYSCLELQKLCAFLLFREAGFKGYILNNAVLMGLEQAVENKEPLLI